MDKIDKSESEWRAQLTPEQFKVCRKQGTEAAFSGDYHDFKGDGVFACVCCGEALFDSGTKFDSGTGWPSYYQPVSSEAVDERADNTLFMRRVEVVCARCDSHLGHVFPDGPAPTGQRYCINSVSLSFRDRG